MPIKRICFFILFFSNVVLSQTIQNTVGSYTITFEANEPLFPAVVAEIYVSQGKLLMATGGGIDHYPNQWASFVKDLLVKDSLGRVMSTRSLGKNGWEVEGNLTGRVSLSYRVDLSFTKEKWPPGNEQAGIWFDKMLYVITKPLFIASDVQGHRVVTVNVPSGWKVSVPWLNHASLKNSYLVKELPELIENSMVVGIHSESVFREGDFTLRLALLGPVIESTELVASTLRAAVRQAGLLFPNTPPATFLVSFFYADDDDGESFETSFGFTTKTRPTKNNIMLWGNNLTHELLHIWIGGQIAGEDSGKTEWFEEGFSDYFADVALSRAGLLSEDVFLRKMEKVLARYSYFKISSNFPRVSLIEAGKRKGPLRFGVYDAGWTVGLCLDILIRENTNGTRTLDDLMRLFYSRYAHTGKNLTNDAFADALEEIAGTEARQFFVKYIGGIERIPVDEFLGRMGLEAALQGYAAELWILKKERLTAGELALLEGILKGRKN